jgi:hypothetical protein
MAILPLEDLRGAHKGEICHVIGKGPSLQWLTEVGPGPVMPISEALMVIERLDVDYPPDRWNVRSGEVEPAQWRVSRVYSLQKDEPCYEPKKPCALILSYHHSRWGYPRHDPRYLFSMLDFTEHVQQFSVIAAAHISKLMGCSGVEYLCCDSLVNEDRRTYEPTLGHLRNYSTNYGGVKPELVKCLESLGLTYQFTIPERSEE